MSPVILETIGWIGAISLLIAYTLNLTQRVDSTSKKYILTNLFGAFLLAINAYYNKSYPFLAINLFWLLTSIFQLLKKKN